MKRLLLAGFVSLAPIAINAQISNEPITIQDNIIHVFPAVLGSESIYCINNETSDYDVFTIYDKNFTEIKRFAQIQTETYKTGTIRKWKVDNKWATDDRTEEYKPGVEPFVTYSNECGSRETHYLTQTFFNDDKEYEYIMPMYKQVVEISEQSDTISSILESYDIIATGIILCNSAGKELQRIEFPDTDQSDSTPYIDIIYLVKIGDKKYLCVGSPHRDSNEMYVYSVNSDKASVPLTHIKTIEGGMRVNPKTPRRSEPVTVTIENPERYDTIELIDINGRRLESQAVNGNESHTINTESLRAGMYIIRAVGHDITDEKAKIIIR